MSERNYRVPDEFRMDRQGKEYVLAAGLLDAAHNQGLRGIDTELVQVPNDKNKNVAIVKAIIEMDEPDAPAGSHTKTFSGIGDASPENVPRNIQPHLIRMAETRAKNRALRDAVDISGKLIAEEHEEQAIRANTLPEVLASKQQQGYLKGLIDQLGVEHGRAQFELKHGAISTFSPENVSYWIDHFKDIVGDEEKEAESDD